MSLKHRLPLSFLMLVSSGAALASGPTTYEMDPDHSSIGIASLDSSQPFKASVANLAGNLRFAGDPTTPRGFDLVFDLSSLDSGDPQLNQLLRGPKYLWVDRHPYGLTLANDVSPTGIGSFRSFTTLALRDISCQVPVTFDWRVDSEAGQSVAYLHGTSPVNARDFGIQNGDPWDRTMTITYDLRLTPALGKVQPVTRSGPDVVPEDYPPARCSSASWATAAVRSPSAVRAAERESQRRGGS